MCNPEPGPMTPEQWDEVSTRGALIAQLRGQRGAGRMIMAELRECREENARLRDQIRSYQAQMVTLYGKLDHLEGELRRAEEVGDG